MSLINVDMVTLKYTVDFSCSCKERVFLVKTRLQVFAVSSDTPEAKFLQLCVEFQNHSWATKLFCMTLQIQKKLLLKNSRTFRYQFVCYKHT